MKSFFTKARLPIQLQQKNQTLKALPSNDNIEKLVKLKELLDSGAITQEEYDIIKKEII